MTVKDEEHRPIALVRGKPAWWARYMRFTWVQMVFSSACLVLIPMVQGALGTTAMIWFFGAFLVGQIAWTVYLFVWMRSYGVSMVTPRKNLIPKDDVLCPNCLYPLCARDDTAGMKLCSECGCVVDGEAARAAWKKIGRGRG